MSPRFLFLLITLIVAKVIAQECGLDKIWRNLINNSS